MLVRKAKEAHIQKIIGVNKDARQIWKAINEIINKKKNQK